MLLKIIMEDLVDDLDFIEENGSVYSKDLLQIKFEELIFRLELVFDENVFVEVMGIGNVRSERFSIFVEYFELLKESSM